MKKIIITSLLFVVAFNLSSCKSNKKEKTPTETKIEVKKSTAAFSLKEADKNISFLAYKTTDKVAVGGQFKKVDIISGGEGNTIKEAINNTEFSVPVSSLFTKDTSRDYKIKKFFFGVMENTKLLSGKLVIENDSIGYTNLKMNGITEKVPFKYTLANNTFSMNATMDVSNWKALEALNSLNTVCKELHKGADGISKTWSEVTLNITTTF
ncbi:YceI family protein [uncultured Polaribacter sp.]|uniref:YceI family protein n=1 Tax=uncultured Polaribacter sp. TaxID=174711 RepID=UPI002604A642|nr:YceI family protein [uncultured Polaribacter sp.]